ncbi:F0F1 ATP synthase subunit A [Candidatus Sumerlaeota bacterium]|nr:F0F1 ATP synthase subunit A [Candidatus Sumerlaeota bacterium]
MTDPVDTVPRPESNPAASAHASDVHVDDAHVAAPSHETGGHEGEHGGGHGVPELENFWNLLSKSSFNEPGTFSHDVIKHFDPYVGDPAHYAEHVADSAHPETLQFEPQKAQFQATVHKTNQNVFFAFLTVLIVILVVRRAVRKRAMIPDRAQGAVEILIEGMSNFFVSVLGTTHGPRHVPFLLGLFFFILFNNLMGLVPFMKSSTSAFQCNIVLGACVFFYVLANGLSHPKQYFLHLAGNPRSFVQWLFSPFIFVLELISELVKPFSLSLRLFGNILGEDILLGVFTVLGISLTALFTRPVMHVANPIVGIPLHLPFMFLATLTSIIQALIFALLACVYVLLVLPHEEEHH